MLRNSFYLPSKKCAFVTTEYLIAVKDLALKVPRFEEVKLRACPIPPKKLELVKIIRTIELIHGTRFGIQAGGPLPNSAWMLTLISTYSPAHEIFKKDYRPAERKPDRELKNDGDFFNGLPPELLYSKKVRRSQVLKRLLKPAMEADAREEVPLQRQEQKEAPRDYHSPSG